MMMTTIGMMVLIYPSKDANFFTLRACVSIQPSNLFHSGKGKSGLRIIGFHVNPNGETIVPIVRELDSEGAAEADGRLVHTCFFFILSPLLSASSSVCVRVCVWLDATLCLCMRRLFQ